MKERNNCCLQIDCILRSLTLLRWALCRSRRVATSNSKGHYSSSCLSTVVLQDLLFIRALLMSSQTVKQLLSTDWCILHSLTLLSCEFCWSIRLDTRENHKHNSSSGLSTLIPQDLLLSWASLISYQRAKQLLSTDWSYITLTLLRWGLCWSRRVVASDIQRSKL